MRGLVFALVFGAALLGAGCSDDASDAIGGACDTIVGQCHIATSHGECIDQIGALSAECIDCISTMGCNYPSCQVSVPGCRIPLELNKK